MLKACSYCGRVHDTRYTCKAKKIKRGSYERDEVHKLRQLNAWKRKSVEIREAANYLCEVCRDKGIYTYQGLEVHHITPLKDDTDGLLENDNLVCLCGYCHEKAEKGAIEADYLRRLANARNER